MNVLQEHMRTQISWQTVSECEIITWTMPAVKLLSKTTLKSKLARYVLKDITHAYLKWYNCYLSTWLFAADELCGNNQRVK